MKCRLHELSLKPSELANETRLGLEVIRSGETVEGAAHFAPGIGPHGEFLAVPPEKLRRHQHPGAEFIYVLSGTLALHIGDEQHLLEAKDSIYFDSTLPHAYRKSGGKACCALVVTTG